MPFKFEKLEIPDVIKVQSLCFEDSRGRFFESFRKSDFEANGIDTDFVQQNCSVSVKNVLRGLHYQLNPYSQGKLIQVISGEIYDVAVDLRKGSPTFKQWVGVNLNSEKNEMLWVPQGFAHGFLTLTPKAEVSYLITGSEYNPQAEAGIIWNDSELAIKWPVEKPLLSDKDRLNTTFANAEMNFNYGKTK